VHLQAKPTNLAFTVSEVSLQLKSYLPTLKSRHLCQEKLSSLTLWHPWVSALQHSSYCEITWRYFFCDGHSWYV